jgi:hypothetical protein
MDNTNKQLDLPFASEVAENSRTKKTPKPMDNIQMLLESVDWALYEEDVLRAVKAAIKDYTQKFVSSPEDKVSQISIWTDPQSRKTAISFETRGHAEVQIQEQIAFWRSRGNEQGIRQSELLQYNGNPADFQYSEFYTMLHHELTPLRELDFRYQKHVRAAQICIKASLTNVVKRIISEGIIKPLPREQDVWIGISSPRDWYDCVQKI